jgi:hypothetical protein
MDSVLDWIEMVCVNRREGNATVDAEKVRPLIWLPLFHLPLYRTGRTERIISCRIVRTHLGSVYVLPSA